jgi:predicted Fe-S protein YdhL (DUF1289 family)
MLPFFLNRSHAYFFAQYVAPPGIEASGAISAIACVIPNRTPSVTPSIDRMNSHNYPRDSAEAGRARPDTPCVAVCTTTFTDVCLGCGRTVSEVANWAVFTPEQKDTVWHRIISEGYPRRG